MRVALVPGVLALLPEYAGIDDPVAELWAVCLEAVGWLGDDVRVIADEQGARVAAYLVDGGRSRSIVLPGTGSGPDHVPESAIERKAPTPNVLVVGNGSAKRSEKAPGHLDERAQGFDEGLGAALRGGDLTDVDLSLADELWASVEGIEHLPGLLHGEPATVDYDDDPFGVQYWVMRWELS